ncbi:hypothetical protein QBC47DRAFT_341333 [Echria macrotheca]|uniref:Nephrocystin 3-like N-terminal domain-containing protein n=1 Tax=Echria macrotheca TaxID=438768 RepID=A0AAJ0BE79_9PEZI|nr:hypothetical protein QBC47DRAFT_341333 [Echria macrotheca]
MDPITAFQVGASVVAFVDFACALVSTGYRVYKSPSGRSERTVRLSQIAKDLSLVQTRIEQEITRFVSNESDQEVLELCQECKRIGADITSTVESLTARGTSKLSFAKSSFAVAARGLWKDGQVEALKERLEQVRSKMMIAIMISIWLDDISRRLGEAEKHIIQEVANIRAWKLTGIENQKEAREQQAQTLADDLWSSDWQPDLKGQCLTSSQWIDTAILRSLSFADMDTRNTMVSQAYGNTYQWVFSQEAGACGFSHWLKAENSDVFWITGKAGSGKSTLMRYITRHKQLESHLKEWANRLHVVQAAYYFWDSGSNPLQKSREGMMRTLLYQCLEQCPDLLPLVAPRRYAMYEILGHNHFTAPPWAWEELEKALSRLAAESGKYFRIALFIDGLDEFRGDRSQLISFIKLLNTAYKIKICVSSRPWTEFADALCQNPRLTIQDFTHNDILFFIKDQLESHPAFVEWKRVDSTTQSLITDIARGAEGIFLWVAVVVRSVLQSLAAGKAFAETQSFVRSIPPDMSKLFTKIWNSIEPEWIETSSRLFQAKVAALNLINLDVKLLWLMEEGGIPAGDDDKVKKGITPILRRKLDMHTRGILEISASGSIEFLHRSAKDWILGPEIWNQIQSKTPPEYDPSLALLKAANTLTLPNINLSEGTYAWAAIDRILTAASNVADRPEVVPHLVAALDELNSILSRLAGVSQHKNPTAFAAKHWISRLDKIRYKGLDHEAETCFVELAARFAILPYVKAKVSLHPELLHQIRRRKRISLLEGAIYGPDEDTSPRWMPIDEDSNIRPLSTAQRWELLNFLLDKGDSPGRKAYRHKSHHVSWKLSSSWSVLEQLTGEWEWRKQQRELEELRQVGERTYMRRRMHPQRRAEEKEPSEGELLQELREKRERLEEIWKEQNAVNLNGDYFDKVLRLLQRAQTTRRNPHQTPTR